MLDRVVKKYLEIYPDDKPRLKLLLNQLDNGEALDDRRNFKGHIAGDAIILSPDLKKILYIYHKRTKRWMQPGGHLDPGEAGPWLTAEREAFEETGIKLAQRVGSDESDYKIPLHIVTGEVLPSKAKNESRHWHHDFRYGFIAATEKLGKVQDDGIGGVRWFGLKEALALKDTGHQVGTSIRRMLGLLQ